MKKAKRKYPRRELKVFWWWFEQSDFPGSQIDEIYEVWRAGMLFKVGVPCELWASK